MKITIQELREMVKQQLDERCQKGYKTHPTRKTKKMFGRTYRNCVKAESKINEGDFDNRRLSQKAQKDLADDMEFLLEKLLSPKIQAVLFKYMHPRFLEMLQGKVHDFKMDVYSQGLGERKLTKSEKSQKEKLAKKYKPAMQSFKDQYGEEGESVYYATMTKKAKEGEKA